MSQRPPTLGDIETAIAEYADSMLRRGETLAQIVAYLNGHGLPNLTLKQVAAWLAEFRRHNGQRDEDPLGGERDECRRADRMEQAFLKAAETVPGAATLLGMERFANQADEDAGPPAERRETMREMLARLLDFVVPELVHAKPRYVCTRLAVRPGHRWELWADSCRTHASTLAIFDGDRLVSIHMHTRPRGKVYQRGGSTWLPITRATLVIQADKDGISQRWIQFAQEFRAARHGRLSQKALAMACNRTKQAISHQRGLIWDKVQASTGGRSVSPGLRNIRRQRGG